MNADEALEMLKTQIRKHKKLSRWTAGINSRLRRAAGVCKAQKQRIELSRRFVETYDWEHVNDVILHEIAHALAPPGAKHGPKWKRIAVTLGCKWSLSATVKPDSDIPF